MRREPEDPRTAEVAALLEAALRPRELDPAAEERAVNAFRAARDEGVRAAPGRWRRRRDDWRPAGRRRPVPSFKALVAGVVAVIALGGVAVAAGEGAIPSPFGDGAEPKPGRSSATTTGPDEGDTRSGEPAPQPSARPTRPPVDDTAAHCRVYLAAVERRGTAPRGAAMDGLERAAGGPEAVRAYCERLLADDGQGAPHPRAHKTGPKSSDTKSAEGKPDTKSDMKSAEGKPDTKSADEKADEKAGKKQKDQPRQKARLRGDTRSR
jgi:hypothetical protein